MNKRPSLRGPFLRIFRAITDKSFAKNNEKHQWMYVHRWGVIKVGANQISGCYPKLCSPPGLEEPYWVYPSNLSSVGSEVCLQMQETAKKSESRKRWEFIVTLSKVNQARRVRLELNPKNWLSANALKLPIRGQKTATIQQSLTKS